MVHASLRYGLGRTAFIALFMLASPGLAAHGGGLNAEGCHNDRKRGGYHCHRAPAARPTAASALDVSPGPGQARSAPMAPYYPNCAAARAAGAAPVRRGDPGYGSHLDRDNDGVGCE